MSLKNIYQIHSDLFLKFLGSRQKILENANLKSEHNECAFSIVFGKVIVILH